MPGFFILAFYGVFRAQCTKDDKGCERMPTKKAEAYAQSTVSWDRHPL